MSLATNKNGEIVFNKEGKGTRDIPSVVRRGMRMNDSQRRFALTASTVLVLLVVFVVMIASGTGSQIVTANEKVLVLRDAIGAERVEMGKKTIEMTQEHGTKVIDGKRVILLQKVGQQKAGNAKTYWLTLCTEAEAPEYETALGKDKKLILLDSRGDTGLWITLAKDSEVEKCRKAIGGAFFLQLSRQNGEADLQDVPAEHREIMAEMMNDVMFIHFGYNEDKAVRLTRGTAAEIEAVENARNSLRLIRIAVIVLLAAAVFVLAYALKSTKFALKSASLRRAVRLSALALGLVLTVVLVVLTMRISSQSDLLIRTGEITVESDIALAAEGRAAEADSSASADEKYVYVSGTGKNMKTVTVSVPQTRTGLRLYRTVLAAAVALLAVLAFALLFFFRYERDLGFPVFNTVILILLMFITLYPVLNTVAYSFNDGTDAARGGIGLLPRKFSLKSYQRILNDPDIAQAGFISVSKTIITTILNLFWTGMLSFALSRREYVLRKPITLVMVLTMYVNAGLIPTYLLISQTLGLRNTFWVYIIPTMYSCFNMIIIRTYIMGLPNELVESARIDGAGDFRIYWQIIFPLCTPVLATVALFVAVGSWNSWFDTMLYIPTERRLDTLQYYLKGKLATAGQTSNLANSTVDAAAANAAFSVTQRTIQCATTVVTALPILIVYPFLQRYFVTGMALGSVKG